MYVYRPNTSERLGSQVIVSRYKLRNHTIRQESQAITPIGIKLGGGVLGKTAPLSQRCFSKPHSGNFDFFLPRKRPPRLLPVRPPPLPLPPLHLSRRSRTLPAARRVVPE